MKKRIAVLALAAALALACAAPALGAGQKALPVKKSVLTGVSVHSSDKAVVDASNLAEGFVIVGYTGGKSVRIKVQIAKEGGVTYTYDLNNTGVKETFPLTEGDGKYTVTVLENTTEDRYAKAYTCTLTLALRDPLAPFLYANQFVNFTAESETAKTAAQIAGAVGDTLGKVKTVFDYVVDNFTYDYDKAATVQSGYLPSVDAVLASKKGICFDYAAVMAAMLRSQGVPCKLVVGYAGTTYHAWINVWSEETGWVEGVIYFNGENWNLMDPTFTSSGKRSDSIMKFVTNTANYQQKYAY